MTEQVSRRHGAMGIAGFVLAVAGTIVAFLDIAVAGYLNVTHQTSAGVNVVVGLVIMLAGFLLLLGIGLALGGLFDRSSKKVFPIVTLVLSVGVVASTLGLMALGLAHAHH